MTAAQMNPELATWLRELDDEFLTAWANRGLLRRGRKLAESLPATPAATTCTIGPDECTATLDGHQQALQLPGGFEQLSCSCPAASACHHLIAFLLYLQKQAASVVNDPAETETGPPPWLSDDLAALEKQLGKSYYKRAQQLLLQAPEIELDDTAGALLVKVTDNEQYSVRIPRSLGIRAATCSCKAERCVHKALAVLAARQQAGLYDPLADLNEALSSAQYDVVEQLQDWLRELVGQGSAGLSRALLERGEALVTVAKQADFPLLASLLSGLLERLNDELAGRSFLQMEQLRSRLAPLWGRLKALRQTPLPQSLQALVGTHKRHYRLVQELELLVIGAEAWQSAAGFCGLSLHCYAPASGEWYRHTQARSLQQAEASDWSPQQCWQHETWGGQRFYNLPLRRICVRRGWLSRDNQLSGRDGTLIESDSTIVSATALPLRTDFASLRADYARTMQGDPLLPPGPQAVVLKIARTEAPVFDSVNQVWSQPLYDAAGQPLPARLLLANAATAAMQKRLDRLWRQGKHWDVCFGWLSLRGTELQLQPVSLRCVGEGKWIQLSL